MDEFEKRIQDNSWDDQIAGSVLSVRHKRNVRKATISTTLAALLIVSTFAVNMTVSTVYESQPVLNNQVYGTLQNVYGSTGLTLTDASSDNMSYYSGQTTDSLILSTLASR